MNNRAYQSSTLLADIIESAASQAAGIKANAFLIDAFCVNMPDDSVAYIYAGEYSVGLTVRGDGEVLTQAIRFLRTRGYRTNDEPPPEKTAHWEGVFTHDELANAPRVRLTWSSTVCRRVKVGTIEKTVTEDVYELRCGPEAVPEDVPA